jgi:hypothetical protein
MASTTLAHEDAGERGWHPEESGGVQSSSDI